MIWLILGWLASGVAGWMLTFGHFQYKYGDVSSTATHATFASFVALLGPMGLVVSAALGHRYAWRYWRNGRKSQAELQRAALLRAGASVGQSTTSIIASTAALNSAFVNAANSVAAFAESWKPEPVEEVTVPEAVIGWRWWSLDPLSMMLRGHVAVWSSGTVGAVHIDSLGNVGGHLSPQASCLCGVNALKPEAVAEYLSEPYAGDFVDVFGRVALTGIVDEYEKGYRGEKAVILELVILSEAPLFTVAGEALLSEMEGRYGVRPTVQSRKSWLAEMEVIHGYGKENQADSFRAGESTAGASQGAGQDGLIHTDNLEDCPACEARYGR
jgi:hypothetical protein